MKASDPGKAQRGFVPIPNRLLAEAECTADIAIYAVVASWRDWTTGVAEIGVQKIAELAHASKPTVLSRLVWLQSRGFIRAVKSTGHSQRRAYQLSEHMETGQPENRSTLKPVLILTGQNEAPEPVKHETRTGKPGNHVLRSKKKNDGTRIPEDFAVTEEHRRFARDNELPSPDDEIGAFLDHWRGQAGKYGVKLDWDATFRNWLRNAKKYSPRPLTAKENRSVLQPTPKPTSVEYAERVRVIMEQQGANYGRA